MNSLPGTIAPDGVLRRVSDLRRALPPCISRPDLKIKIPLTPPVRSNDRHTAFVRGIFSALPRRDFADSADCEIARNSHEPRYCVLPPTGRRTHTNRGIVYCFLTGHRILYCFLCAPMRKCENRHHSRNKERCRKASYGQLRAMRSHRRALRERYRAPRLPPP